MQKVKQEYWRNKYEKLKAENILLREKLANFKREARDLQKVIKNNNKLFNSIPAGILLLQQGRIVDINKGALHHLGYGPEEVIGHNFLDFVHPELKKSMKDLHHKRVSGKRVPSQYETDLVTRDGERVSCEVRVKRIRFNGRRAFLANLTLLERRKKRERDQIQLKKKEALMTMASGLHQKLNHDHKEISENLQLVKGIMDSENESLRKRLENIESASKEIHNTIRVLESLSATKRDPSEDVLFDLRKEVKKAIARANPALKDLGGKGKQKINLKTYLRSVSPIEGNPEEIRDLVIHLILNAVEAMPRGGDLYLTTEENAGYAHIYIQDSGVGIPAPIKDRIWDPFYSTKGKDGLGLGLSLSHAVVKRHNGEMEVSSQKDHGTTFTITLPIAQKSPRPKSRSVKRKIKNAQILMIRDEDIVSELLSKVLVSRGHKVVMASSGSEGLQKLKKKKFDLVLADSAAADMGRAGFIQKINKMNKDLSFVLMKGQTAGEKPGVTRKSAIDLIIRKPLDMDKVVGQVENLLRRKSRR
ncbi:MAG: PAS domain S-box protein [Desulfobacteraceae bacterium]|jgi:PAS domain S-box-containing protein